MTSNNGDVVGVWAPNNYTLEEKAGAKTLCTGADAGAIIPGALVVRADYAKQNPKNVAAYLAVYLHSLGWEKANRSEAHEMIKTFYAQGGVDISDQAIDQEFALRPVFPLDQQLKIMNRSKRRLRCGPLVFQHRQLHGQHWHAGERSRREVFHH